MRNDWLSWLAIKNRKGQPWKAQIAKSVYGWTAVREFFEAAAACDWVCGESLLLHCDRLFRGQGTTLVTENAFRVCRDAARAQPNEKISIASVWGKPRDAGLLTDVFAFDEVSCELHHESPAQSKLPQSLVHPRMRQTSLDFRELTKRQTSWQSYTGMSWSYLAADTHFMRQCYDQNLYSEAPKAWRTQFLQEGTVVINASDHFFLVLCVMAPMAYLWPLQVHAMGTNRCACLGEGPLADVFCYDLTKWKAQDFEWLCPLKAMKLSKTTDWQECENAQMLFMGDPVPLVSYAAQQGFWHMSSADVQRLAKHDYGRDSQCTMSFAIAERMTILRNQFQQVCAVTLYFSS